MKGGTFEIVRNEIDQEYKTVGFSAQCKRDAQYWFQTLMFPGNKKTGELLSRIFVILRYGGLFYRTNNKTENGEDISWKCWYERKWPIATVLSHGGRIVVQLPKSDSPDKYDLSFWTWLMSGNENGELNEYISNSTSGDACLKDGTCVFRRLGATHSLSSLKKKKKIPFEELPCGRKKYICEVKTSGIGSLKDTKVFGSKKAMLEKHKHWGCNLPIGGHNRKSRATGEKILADGTNGHLYIYFKAPKGNEFGGVMFGVEGSEPGKKDASGAVHSMAAKSAVYSPTLGYKWFSKTGIDLKGEKGPGKYDCMFIDLSTGWRFLKNMKQFWQDSFVFETTLPALGDPLYSTISLNQEKRIPSDGLARKKSWELFLQKKKAALLSNQTTTPAITENAIPNTNENNDKNEKDPAAEPQILPSTGSESQN